MKADNTIKDKSLDFAIRIVRLYKHISETNNEYILSKQLLKSGTSIGANVREAIGGQSKENFIAKMHIALKEAYETEYWLELLYSTDYLAENEFKSIFACEFLYDENGNGIWPKTDVNYTNKTQFVYRINKGVLDVANDNDLNKSMPDDSKRIPFCNMIYIGDGLSDVPCMKMMKAYGGYSIAVYQKKDAKVEDLLQRGRVDYIYPADYSENSGLDNTVKNIIQKMAISETLYREYSKQKHEINN